MAKKRKTLPKEFQQLVDDGDISVLKSVFEKCDLNAYGDYYKMTALSYDHLPNEMLKWLVEEGADLEAKDRYGDTALHHHCKFGNIRPLLELGANIEAVNNEKLTPLHIAADNKNVDAVNILLSRKANPLAKGSWSEVTPLEYTLTRCSNIDISSIVKVAESFSSAGAQVTKNMKESVIQIGKRFEFYRENFNPEFLDEADSALKKLYQIFDVEVVAHRMIHDGISPIAVTETEWSKQHQELWDFLVPASGCAKTLQGEVIRITGRVANEILGNGGVNWDKEYRKILSALMEYFQMGNPLSDIEQQQLSNSINSLQDGYGDEEPAELCKLAVHWVLANPQPILLEKPEYKR